MSFMKKERQETHAYVGVASGGDYIPGSSLGVALLVAFVPIYKKKK